MVTKKTESEGASGPITDNAAKAVYDKDTRLMDPGQRGEGRLVLRIKPGVGAAAARTFSFRYSYQRVQVSIPIGPYGAAGEPGTYTVKTARAAAAVWRALQAVHPDLKGHLEKVAAEKAAAAQAASEELEAAALASSRRLTVRQVFDRWVETDLKMHVNSEGKRCGRKDNGEWVRQSFVRHLFPRLGGVVMADVRKADIMVILDTLKAAGTLRTCNVLLADMKQLFAFAVERDIIEHSPIASLKKKSAGGKDIKRERVLNEGEIKLLAKQLPKAAMAPRSVLAIWLILSTAVRVSEAMNAEWQHVNLQARTWYLPDTKNQRDHLIHLSEFAMVQLRALSALRESVLNEEGIAVPSPWLFPDSKGKGPLDSKTLQKQLADRQRLGENRLNGRSKLTDILWISAERNAGKWTCHDLRRSAATLMGRLGISDDVINECLNHKLQGISGVYVHDRRLPQQALAFNALGAKLAELTSGTAAPSNVVLMQPIAA